MQQQICVDYDGTIVDFEFPKSGAIKPGAKEALQKFHDLGYRIVIWSCRTSTWFEDIFPGPGEDRHDIIEDMRSTLDSNQIPYDEIDDGTRGKPFAVYYIDDRAIGFHENWPQIADFVKSRTL